MNNNKDYTVLSNEVAEYFMDYDIEISPNFDIIKCAAHVGMDPHSTLILLCNLEDEAVMKEIAIGDYSNFDSADRSIFNDCYEDMIEELFPDDDDDDDDDEEIENMANDLPSLEELGIKPKS